jgi:hypothetical protein
MGEFANRASEDARLSLRRYFHHEPIPAANPILELIGFLLEDKAGGVFAPPEAPVTTSQWTNWNELMLDRQQELVEEVTNLLDEERMRMPPGRESLRSWAACLLLLTLDRMGLE